MKVAPSILSADFANLGRDVRLVSQAADYIHLDIMDGTFVPNISFGFPVVKAAAKETDVPLDAHLMVVNPQKWFETLRQTGCSMVSFHYETTRCRTGKYIRKIHSMGMKAGVAINPDVPVKKILKYVGKADFILIMSVFAGFGGQKFIYQSIDRINEVKAEIDRKGAKTIIEVDGGVSLENIGTLAKAGVGIVVAGSTVFGAEDPVQCIRDLQKA